MTIDSFSNVFEYVFDPGGERLRGERGDVCLTCGPRGRSAERERGVFFEAAAACAGERSRFAAAAAALLCDGAAAAGRAEAGRADDGAGAAAGRADAGALAGAGDL